VRQAVLPLRPRTETIWLLVMAVFLGAPTLGLRQATPANVLAANRQGVKIVVRFLGLTERQAVDRLAALLAAHNESLRESARRAGLKDWRLAWPTRYLHPCEQLRQLWTSYALPDPQPMCDPTFPRE